MMRARPRCDSRFLRRISGDKTVGLQRVAIALVAMVFAFAPGSAFTKDSAARLWAKVRKPSAGSSESIGGYSRGCIAGARALALNGTNHVVAKPSRQRYFGHAILIAFIEDYARSLREHGLGLLVVGDLGQARGGPAPNGHKSHQSGLDVDLWYQAPVNFPALRSASASQMESVEAQSLLVEGGLQPLSGDSGLESKLRRAAIDPRVDRIFVHPRVKEFLCKVGGPGTNRGDSTWLAKIRPWWGHDAHFHVRLRCPDGDHDCESQEPVPKGDGCDELAWWFDPKAQVERRSGQAEYRKNMGDARGLPDRCAQVLKKSAASPGP
jgi:penicillin-insensitive murein endopeptidase